MSEEQLKAFLEAIKADAGLQEKLKVATDLDAVVEIAKGAGFEISAEELQKAQAEVSEDELEGRHGWRSCLSWLGGFFVYLISRSEAPLPLSLIDDFSLDTELTGPVTWV